MGIDYLFLIISSYTIHPFSLISHSGLWFPANIPATVSNACASAGSILLPAVTGFSSLSTTNCPVRSKCSLILLSMYSCLSSFVYCISSADLGNVASLGRSRLSASCSAGSCDKMNVIFVVNGVLFVLDPAAIATCNCCAAGLDVKNVRSRSRSGRRAAFASPPFPPADLASCVVDRIVFSWDIIASFCAHSCFRDLLSFRVW